MKISLLSRLTLVIFSELPQCGVSDSLFGTHEVVLPYMWCTWSIDFTTTLVRTAAQEGVVFVLRALDIYQVTLNITLFSLDVLKEDFSVTEVALRNAMCSHALLHNTFWDLCLLPLFASKESNWSAETLFTSFHTNLIILPFQKRVS